MVSKRLARNISCFVAIFCSVGLTGCALYHPLPLPTQPNYANSCYGLAVESMRYPEAILTFKRLETQQALDIRDIEILALINNPMLKSALDDSKIANAHIFAAGLIPDPTVNLVDDIPTNPVQGTTKAFNIGLNEDLTGILLRQSTLNIAKADKQKTDLTLLWQEWQTLTQAKVFYIRKIEQQKLLGMLETQQKLLADGYAQLEIAMKKGYITSDIADTELSALQNINKQINDLKQQIVKNNYDLNNLLNLAPGTKLNLIDDIRISTITPDEIQLALSQLPCKRPDLLALQAAYASQDQHYWQAILSQFPAVNVGVTRARDNTNIYSDGMNITFTLPIFNRNQGNIAIECATRQKLYDEYQARLNSANSEIQQILETQALLKIQQTNNLQHIVVLKRLLSDATAAYQAGNIDILAYTLKRANLIDAETASITLEQSIYEQQVGLQTLLGVGLPLFQNKSDHIC